MKRKIIKYKLIILSILFSVLLSNINAQEYFFKEYNESDGLPSGNVFDIAQDTLGRMWFATRNGIVSYDGAQWNSFDDEHIFDQLIFVKVKLDNDGTIWTVNESRTNSLFYYKNEEWNEYPLDKSVQNAFKAINQFQIGTNQNDTLIALSGFFNKIAIYNQGEWNLHSFNTNVNIYSLELLSDKLLICTSEGIYNYDRKTSKFNQNYEKVLGLDFYPIQISKIDKDENRFIAFGKSKLARIEGNNVTILSDKLEYNYVSGKFNRSFLVANYLGGIVFGNTELVYEFDTSANKLKLFTLKSKINQLGTTSLFVDFEKNLWISGFRGLLKMQSPYVKTFNQKSGLMTDEVTSVLQRNGKFYFGHENGLTIYDGNKFKIIRFNKDPNEPSRNRILDMCLDDDDNLWFAVNGIGFGKLTKSDEFDKWYVPDNKNTDFNSFLLTSDGKFLASNTSRIFEYDGTKFNVLYEIGENHQSVIRKMFSDHNGNLVIATMSRGLLTINKNDERKFIKSSLGSSSNSVYSFYSDSLHTFVGTAEGLFTMSGDTLQRVTNKYSLTRPIYFITRDTKNNFWFGTDNGVMVSLGNGYFHLNPRNGLLGYESNRDAGFVDSNGKIWVGTDRGLSSFCNNFLSTYQKSKPKVLALIKEDGKYVPLKNRIIRDHNTKNIELYVASVSFIDEDSDKIIYELIGIDQGPKTLEQKEGPYITFYNLASGDYELSIKAVNAFQIQSESSIKTIINIKKAFYNEWWFYLLVLLIFIPFIYITIRYFERKRQAQYLENEVSRRTLQLSDSEKKYKNLLNKIQDAVFVIQDSKLIYVNDAFIKMIGYEYDEVVNVNFGKFIAPEDLDFVKDRYQRRLRGELVPAEYEMKMLHKNGFTRIFVNMHVGVFDYEGKATTIGTIKDVTAFKMSQEKIIKSEARLRALTNMLPDMMFELDENGHLIDYHLPDVSPIPVHPLKLVGKNIKEFLPRSLYRMGMGTVVKALETGQIQLKEFFINRDGRKSFYEARVVVSSDKKALVIIRDISDRKESEKQLIEAKEQAEQSDKLKSEFLAQVSHEIRTPINTILNFASLIKEDCSSKIDPDLKDSFNVIENGGRRLIRTIDLILNMSQVQTHAYKPNYKILNIDDDVLASVYSELKSFAESKKLNLNYEIENSLKEINGDSYTLGQIFVNLIDNAIKYTLNGSITIKSYSDDNNIYVEIIDTGIGISKEFLPSVFSPFSQEETGYTRKFEGTGLGLALVKSYVELNSGEISVKSQKGVGTSFTVKFRKV